MYTLTMDYSPRHCWEMKDGTYRSAVLSDDSICTEYKDHIFAAGQTEFLRWIREFGILAPGIVTGFPDGWLNLGEDINSLGHTAYCENYGGKVKAFLYVKDGFAHVEIHDDTLVDAAKKAKELVALQYDAILLKSDDNYRDGTAMYGSHKEI